MLKRIRKWTEWQAMPHREKSLYEEFQFITIMAKNAGIPRIFIDDAMAIHKEISAQKMFRGMNRDGIKSASRKIQYCRLIFNFKMNEFLNWFCLLNCIGRCHYL